MHQFICKVKDRKLVPINSKKVKLLNDMISDYERLGMTVKITLETSAGSNINISQISLYKVFILNAADHFGNSFKEMEDILKHFHPLNSFGDVVLVDNWKNKDLDDFINKANALLLDADSDFKF
jgi:5'(3')-deoxyribonucleotidase